MNKYLFYYICILASLLGVNSVYSQPGGSPSGSYASAPSYYLDGCMDLNVKALRSWNQEYEDPFFNDESSWQWYVADNGNVDGAGYFGGACLQQGGAYQIGWWNHSDYNMHTFSYGSAGPNSSAATGRINIWGKYEGDDCGGSCSSSTGFFNCTGDDDDYRYNESVATFINYRFAAPNQNNIFQRFTYWHGSSDYGGEFSVNYTSPRPSSVTASISTICDDGSSAAVVLNAAGAVFGGSYQWYVGAGFTPVGSGSSIAVDPIADAGGGTSVTYHVYTRNGTTNSLCYRDITIDIVNCDFNCTAVQSTSTVTIPSFTNNFVFGSPTTGGFPAGSYITDVNVSTSFIKSNPNSDIGFELIASASGTSCTSTSLVNHNFTGNGQSLTSVLFDEESTNNVASDPQTTSVVDPIGNLACFYWSNPNRNWTLRVDHQGTSSFQVTDFEVDVCACKPPTSATITESSSNSITICETQGSTLELNVSGSLGSLNNEGYGDEVRWFADVCYTGTYLGSGNPFTITAPTTPGTYTYYGNYYVDGVACDRPAIPDDECQVLTVIVTAEPVAGAVVQGGNIEIDICENTSPGLLTLVGSNESTPGISLVRWEVSTDGGINWTAISNTTPTYNPGTLATIGTFYYRAVLSNSGCGDTYSDFIIVNVFETPDAGNTGMLSIGNTYCSDTIFRMSTSGYIGALQWQISDDSGFSYADIPGQSSDDLTYFVTNLTELPIDYYFRVNASNQPCSDDYSSPPEIVTIYPATQGGLLSSNQDVCENTLPNDLLLENVHGDSIIWEIDDNIGFTSPTDLGHVEKVIGLDNTLAGTTIGVLTSTVYIRARVINEYCTESLSNTVTLTVFTPPTNAIFASQNLCVGDIPNLINGTLPTGGTGTYLYQWQSSPAGSGTWTDITGENSQNLDPIAFTANTSFRRVVTSGPCISVSNEVTVIYNVNPSFTSVTPMDITCFGAGDGSINVLANNTDSVSLDGGLTYFATTSFTGLAANSYNVFIKNTFSCLTEYPSNPVVINEPLQITFTTVDINPSCSNTLNGSITINVTNGVGALNYSINGGGTQTGNVFSGLAAGTYSILVSDVNSCTASGSVTLSDLYTLALNVDLVTNTSCFGQNDGSIELGTVGGVGPFMFSIDGVNFQPDSLFTGLASGLYTVYTEDVNGCTASSSTTISDSPEMLINLDSVVSVLCNGDNTGGAYISVTGGLGAYTYLWSNGDINEDLVGVTEGSYNVIVTSGGCSSAINVTINEPTVLAASIVSVTDVSCNGGSNGSIDVSVSGGTTPYSFSWSNGDTIEDLFDEIGGAYTLNIIDANGCTFSIDTIIGENTAMVVVGIGTNSSCDNSSNGSIDVSVSGGQSPYTYALNGGPTQSSNIFNGLEANSYNINVTDINGCTASGTALILNDYSLTLSTSAVTNVSCAGQNDGEVQLSTTGGQAPFTFTVNGSSAQTDSLFTGLPAGLYNFEVVDANGCSSIISTTISENPPMVIVLDSITDVLCNGDASGAVYVSVSGGDGSYSYAWTGGSSNEDLVGVVAGAYNLTVTDGAGCTSSMSANISSPNALVASLNSINDVTCAGGSNGSIDVSVSGGTTVYTYTWSDGSGVVGTTEDLYNVIAGVYTLTIADDNGCTSMLNATVNEITAMIVVGVGTNSSCDNSNDGSITVNVTGGVGPYSYALDGGPSQSSNVFNGLSAAAYTIDVIDLNGCIATGNALILNDYTLTLSTPTITDVSCSGQNDGEVQLSTAGGQAPFTFTVNGSLAQSDSLFTGLPAGLYNFEAVDANGCSSTVSATISENPPMVINLDSIIDVLCNGDASGAIYVSVSGGDGTYTYAWTGGSVTEDLVGVVAGAYNLTVTDGAGCTVTTSANISSPTALAISVNNIQDVSCNGLSDGAADVSVSGGTTPYSYSWSDASGIVGTSEDLMDVPAGLYLLSVTDANGCISNESVTISENAVLTGVITTTDIFCYGEFGSASVSVTGGQSPYSYLWSTFDTTTVANDLTPGMVSVIITDKSGCSLQLFDTIISPLAPLSVSLDDLVNVTCNGGNDGSIMTTVSGGTSPYTIAWLPNGEITDDISTLTAGDYTITVTDANNCTTTETYTVVEAGAIITTLSVTNPTCYGEETGMVVVGNSGGNAPYTYSWNTTPLQSGVVAVNLAGNQDYVVTITDVNGCVQLDTASVVYPLEMLVTTIPTSVSCLSEANGTVSVSVENGNAPFQYELNGFLQPDTFFNGLDVGNYVVFVEDNNNCVASASFEISGTSALEAELEGAGNDMNYVTDNLFIVRGELVNFNVNLLNDTGNVIVGYNWYPDEVDTTLSNTNPTMLPVENVVVVVEVLEATNGGVCSIYDTLRINVSQEALLFVPTAFSPNNEGDNNFFEINVLGATNLNVQIFNRWGEKVFDNPNQGNGPNDINDLSLTDGSNPRGAWDGKFKGEDVPTGSFIYQIEVTYFDDTTEVISGTVTVIR